jgi:hypothetical protein
MGGKLDGVGEVIDLIRVRKHYSDLQRSYRPSSPQYRMAAAVALLFTLRRLRIGSHCENGENMQV